MFFFLLYQTSADRARHKSGTGEANRSGRRACLDRRNIVLELIFHFSFLPLPTVL